MPDNDARRRNNIDPADSGDYGTDDFRSTGGRPRAHARSHVSPEWPHPIDDRDEVFPGPDLSHRHARSIADAFGFSVPRNYPYADVASERRRPRAIVGQTIASGRR